jgi:hypothetical protein
MTNSPLRHSNCIRVVENAQILVGPQITSNERVCQEFCVNGLVLFLGMGSGEGGNSPSPARRYRRRRFHCVILSSAGIRSGHKIMKWFKASRQR